MTEPKKAISRKAKDIPLDKIKAYADRGFNATEIAKLCDCTHQNITQRMEKFKEQFQHVEFYRANKRSLLDLIQFQILCSIEPDELKKMALRDRITAYGILYDKSRIEAGEDIVKIDIRMLHSDLNEIKRKKEELIAKLQSKPLSPEPQP